MFNWKEANWKRSSLYDVSLNLGGIYVALDQVQTDAYVGKVRFNNTDLFNFAGRGMAEEEGLDLAQRMTADYFQQTLYQITGVDVAKVYEFLSPVLLEERTLVIDNGEDVVLVRLNGRYIFIRQEYAEGKATSGEYDLPEAIVLLGYFSSWDWNLEGAD